MPGPVVLRAEDVVIEKIVVNHVPAIEKQTQALANLPPAAKRLRTGLKRLDIFYRPGTPTNPNYGHRLVIQTPLLVRGHMFDRWDTNAIKRRVSFDLQSEQDMGHTPLLTLLRGIEDVAKSTLREKCDEYVWKKSFGIEPLDRYVGLVEETKFGPKFKADIYLKSANEEEDTDIRITDKDGNDKTLKDLETALNFNKASARAVVEIRSVWIQNANKAGFNAVIRRIQYYDIVPEMEASIAVKDRGYAFLD